MPKSIIYILLSFCLWSCNHIEKPKKPDNLISKNKMIDILTDISLVNAARSIDKKLLEENGINVEDYVFKKYSIDSIQFANSSNYYAYDVKKYEDIYTQVKNRLEQQKANFEELKKTEKEKKDSLRNAERKIRDSLKQIKKDRDELLIEFKPDDLLKKADKPRE